MQISWPQVAHSRHSRGGDERTNTALSKSAVTAHDPAYSDHRGAYLAFYKGRAIHPCWLAVYIVHTCSHSAQCGLFKYRVTSSPHLSIIRNFAAELNYLRHFCLNIPRSVAEQPRMFNSGLCQAAASLCVPPHQGRPTQCSQGAASPGLRTSPASIWFSNKYFLEFWFLQQLLSKIENIKSCPCLTQFIPWSKTNHTHASLNIQFPKWHSDSARYQHGSGASTEKLLIAIV